MTLELVAFSLCEISFQNFVVKGMRILFSFCFVQSAKRKYEDSPKEKEKSPPPAKKKRGNALPRNKN